MSGPTFMKGFSISAEPEDPGGFAQLVRQLSQNPAKLEGMSKAAFAAAPDYERPAELRKLLNILEEAVTRGPRRI